MSHVYLAEEEGLGRRVVIKLLPPGASEAEAVLRPVFLPANTRSIPLNLAGSLAGQHRFAALWNNADAPLQPMVQRARQRIAELTKERP